jgi:hypothetical protein
METIAGHNKEETETVLNMISQYTKEKDTLLRHMILVCNASSTLEPCALQTKKYSAHA